MNEVSVGKTYRQEKRLESVSLLVMQFLHQYNHSLSLIRRYLKRVAVVQIVSDCALFVENSFIDVAGVLRSKLSVLVHVLKIKRMQSRL